MKFCLNHKTRKVFSKGLCLECYKKEYQKPLKRTPLKKKPYFIKKVANKRKGQLLIYSKRRKIVLLERPICEFKGINCTIKATEIHHIKGRENDLLLDERWWKTGCHSCHSEATENSKEAIDKGNSISRHEK